MTRRTLMPAGADAIRRERLRGRRGRAVATTKPSPKKRVNRSGRPTLDELERRKRKIMRVATSLFTKHGYAATTLVDIARSAGVATRTLYQHFGGKELIFHDVMFARETAAVFPPPELAPEDSLFDAMMKAANYACEVTFRPQTIDLMRLAISESKRFPEMMRTLIDASNARFRANVKELIDELVDRRMIKDADTAAAADMFIHLIIGDTSLLSIGGWKANPPSAKQLNEKVELFILGRWGPSTARKARLSKPGKRPPTRASKPKTSST